MDDDLTFLAQEPDELDAADAMLKAMDTDDENLSDDDADNDPDNQGDDNEDTSENDEDPQDDEDHDPDADDTDDDDDAGDDDDGADADEAEAEPSDIADEVEILVKVNGKDERVSIGDLKRLAGQEVSLGQKAQAVAEQRRTLDAQGIYVAKIMQTRWDAAKAEQAKYANVDLYRASRELETDEFNALRAAKEGADNEIVAIEREGAEFIKTTNDHKQSLLREQAKESLKVIAEKIPDWSDKLYDEVRTFAIGQGMDSQQVNEIVDPGAIIMMHKAMQFDNLQSSKAKVTKKVTKAPRKSVSASVKATDTKASKLKSTRRTAMETGDVDDVTALFLASMEE